MKILMVCLGNICRSPLAEGILRHKTLAAGLRWQVDSAGTNSYHIGEPPHHLSQKVARKNGVDISCQVARRFEPADFDKYDMIYVMAEDVMADVKNISGNKFNQEKIRFFLHEKDISSPNVPDPWYGDEDGYHEVYELISDTCDAIIKNYLAKQKKEIQ